MVDRRLFLILALGLLACTGGQSPAPAGPASAPAPRTGARTLPIPAPSADAAPTAQGSPSVLVWTTPAEWREETPANRMRVSQYRVPGPAGDAELAVFYFGPGQGGDALANARRWASQFTQPDGRPSEEAMRVAELDRTRVPVQLVEIRGTYDGGMSGSAEQPGSMLLGGIAAGADAPWFFKLTGPEGTVEAQREAFLALLRSVRPHE
jgi:hypothetical protein